MCGGGSGGGGADNLTDFERRVLIKMLCHLSPHLKAWLLLAEWASSGQSMRINQLERSCEFDCDSSQLVGLFLVNNKAEVVPLCLLGPKSISFDRRRGSVSIELSSFL
jgi:hypothetical protein